MNTKNPLVIAILCFVVALGLVFAVDKMITKRIAQELNRDYVPGPYQPGFDPDKVRPQAQPTQPQYSASPQSVPFYAPLPTPGQWNQQWENNRL